ncbi:MAG: Sensor histidine kinase RcsC [Pseudomonadota bacterium]
MTLNLQKQVAIEKLKYMHQFAQSSTVATILAPLLCIPLYLSIVSDLRFYTWFALMTAVVLIRILLVRRIEVDKNIQTNFTLLNWGVGLVTLVWGLGWLILVPAMDPVNYLIYQIISLTVLFVGMVGYCVNWRTFFCFVLPLKIPELIFTIIYYQFIIWPIALGSMVAFYLALKMGFLFSKFWEKSISLRHSNETLITELIAEKDASVAANLAKSEFIATASHDLRQPMQAINIFMEMISTLHLKPEDASIFKKMRLSINLLNKMFNTLLDINKLDSNAVVVAQNNFDLDSVLDEIKESFYPLAQDKGIDLVFDYQNQLVTGDAVLLMQILRNLLANAIQYTQKGVIHVAFTEQEQRLVLSVSDTGCGISEQDLPFIYKEFFRAENSRAQHDGLGLGLSIVSRIAKIIRAELTVESVMGQGSTFTVKTNYPVIQPLEVDAAKHPSLHHGSVDALQMPAATYTPAHEKHLGIMENDLALVDAYAQFFSNCGFVVHRLPFVEADFYTELLNVPKLDFILSDYRLADKDGVYFIQKLRDEFNSEIPACILTADTSPHHLVLFNELNIQVLYKPIDVKDVLKFIVERLQSASH